MKRSLMMVAVTFSVLAGGCASDAASRQGYSRLYEQGLATHAGDTGVPAEALQRFMALYSPLNADYIQAHLDQVYAPRLYFNDTLVTLYDRQALRKHLLDTAKRLDSMSLDVQRSWHEGEDVFVQWIMEARFSILGSQRQSRTIGISQLRFNKQGQVVFHQDFWDSSQGLDQQIPIVGAVPRWLRNH
ncbi:nuclear transport factor 2 family protein [Alloalcanivorax mobilis]|uniref:nuclear transport factor 2 family protein n=1 Tax=Alloalcanivorax mobilis TaxID=2019569 RepID=UPI000C780C7C|nr:nuclear transport factor 2 family protein [Alloalcanivorax mobilis]